MGEIYIIKNTVNNKVYIGQTINTSESRFAEHKRTDSKIGTKLGKAFEDIGLDNFYVEKLCICSNEELDKYEIKYIQEYDSYNNGYNSTNGGRHAGTPHKNNEIVNKVHELIGKGYSKDEISIELNVSKHWLSSIAKFDANNGKAYSTKKKPVVTFEIIDGIMEIIHQFDCVQSAYKYFVENKLCADNMSNFYTRVKESCTRHNIAFGYRWAYDNEYTECINIDNIKGINNNNNNNNNNNSTVCKVCGGKKSKYADMCVKCSNMNKSALGDISKEELEYMVKHSGLNMEQVADNLGVSSNAVRKWCKKYSIDFRVDNSITIVELNRTFKSYTEAAQYMIDNKLSDFKNKYGLAYQIHRAQDEGKAYNGYTFI